MQDQVASAPTQDACEVSGAALATQISGGSATPDVFTGDVTWPGQFGADQLALPLSEHLPPDYWSQFAAGLVQGASYQGKVYGSPLLVDQGFLYYRKDVLAKAGMSPPTAWEQQCDVRLRCLGQALVTALTSADLRREVVPGLLHLCRLSLCRLSLCRRVRFTYRFTEPVLDLRLSALPRARTRALRPVGSSSHRRSPARGAGKAGGFTDRYSSR